MRPELVSMLRTVNAVCGLLMDISPEARGRRREESPKETCGSIRIFSDLVLIVAEALADARRALKSQGRLTVGLFERRAEMAVAGEPEIERQTGQIGIIPKQVERSRQSQLQVVAIKR